jgi:ribosomal protein S18 acetylase RimI-like enzyme
MDVATARDASRLAALRAAVARDMTRQHGDGGWSVIPGKATVLRQIKASRVLIARMAEEIVGTVRLMPANSSVFDTSAFTPVSSALYVFGLAVAPAARHLGVGRRLMDAAKAAVPAWPADALWLDAYDSAAGAGPFYRRCGFREVRRAMFNGVPLIYFEWLAAVECSGASGGARGTTDTAGSRARTPSTRRARRT